MFKNKLFTRIILSATISVLSLSAITLTNVNAATTSQDNTGTYQMFPTEYADQYLDGLTTDITIPSYDLPSETDGYWRNYDQFLAGDMTTWLGQTNLNYAKSARNNTLVKSFLYRLSPADDDFSNFATNVVPDLKKNGGTANLKLQVLNNYNSGQVLREQPMTVHVPKPMSELDVNFQDTIKIKSTSSADIFKNTYLIPNFTITDKDNGKTYQATKISPVNNVYLDGKKVALSDLPKTLKAGTYTQSIFFTVDGMSQAQLSQLSANSRIVGNGGTDSIRYSNGQLIAARTVVIL